MPKQLQQSLEAFTSRRTWTAVSTQATSERPFDRNVELELAISLRDNYFRESIHLRVGDLNRISKKETERGKLLSRLLHLNKVTCFDI